MAVLFSYNPKTGEHTADPLVGCHPDGMDPISWAFALQRSVEDDHPGWMWSVVGNDEARELRTEALMASMGLG